MEASSVSLIDSSSQNWALRKTHIVSDSMDIFEIYPVSAR